MSNWQLRKPNVTLAVTRFAPDKPVAGLTDAERAAHREKRQAECAKVETAIESDGCSQCLLTPCKCEEILEADLGYDPPERLPREELPDTRYDRIPGYERYRNEY